MAEQWYWCFRHQQVESREMCAAKDRMGPYASPEEARDWRERHKARAKDWSRQDEQYEGE